MTNTAPSTRLPLFAQAIAQAGLDLYLVPMADEFQGEYIPPCAARLPYLTGFTGSAGLGVFWAAPGEARRHTLFVDGRYVLQAPNEVDTTQVAIVNSGDVTLAAWLATQGDASLRVGFDPWLVTAQQLAGWKKATAARPVTWVAHTPNLVDTIWPERPAAPSGEVHVHPLSYAGVSYAEKRRALLAQMETLKADALVLTQPDGINWLLNLRGADIDFNPLLLSYLVLQKDGKAILYLHEHSFSVEVADYLKLERVVCTPLDALFAGVVPALPTHAKVMMDPSSTAQGWYALAEKAEWEIIAVEDPTLAPKAAKNTTELEGIRAAHRRDGLALTAFLHWFDAEVAAGTFPQELAVVAKLDEFRRADAMYRGPSFATIAGSGAHGAIVHYRADEKSNRRVNPGELFLLDSGGQYPDGTTDVTRTISVGIPSPAMKDHYTRVLKGHIGLAAARFPAGTSGVQLDVLARQHLWAAGLDFDHGTGHGVGAYLCVHEGPQRISKRGSAVALVEGMIISNEPGFYAANQYGIRIESLVAVVAVGTMANGQKQLGFETLTLAPIDTRLVEVNLLTAEERNWLNNYHQRVYKAHADGLSEKARHWLEQATRAI